ncbi:uncharacterized protein C2orf73 homolog [Hydractinia symbiolongicarpus]|uniref:uncharacterized protein C2orf73 homolog n=1 Tax=Hydractinia symbiolongicarpus TaxID=13093 RepID=UPI00254D2599|nr:uncharacterized protein C2orf73 homolog [Hydractinia symbiolongicarpus]
MSTSLPCLMTRKKKIPGTKTFDAEKVLADFTPGLSTQPSSYRSTYYSKKKCSAPVAGKTKRNNSNNVCFLYENPRFINEPICFANSKETSPNQAMWWPDSVPVDQKPNPAYKKDTVNRSDYAIFTNAPPGLTRFGCNKNMLKTAQGIVPTGSDKPLIAKEKISYEHQFDCRQNRRERGKLHGSFVWKPISDRHIQERIRLRLKQQNSNIFD